MSWLAWVLLREGAPGPKAYIGGIVLTMDRENRIAEALATRGERIELVGTRQEVEAWARENDAEIVELEGRTLLPGFIDAHGHFPGEGVRAVFVDLNPPPTGDVEDIPGVIERLRARAAETEPGEWISGIGYDDTLLAERRHPTRHDLDAASTAHPISVSHISGHLNVVNTRGLEELGLTADSEDPVGGVIRREPDGTPNGVLEETAAAPLTELLLPSGREAYEIFAAAIERYLANGVTTAQSGATTPAIYRALDWAAWSGTLPLRVVVWPDRLASDQILAGELEATSWGPLWLRHGATKLIADGSIQGYTGYLSEPYAVPPGDDPGYRGYPRIQREELFRLVDRYHSAGLQVAVHGNGDAAIDDILDAYQAAQARTPRADARHVIIHAQMAREDQLDRMKELGVIPSFFVLHTFYWGDRHRELFMGEERAARMSPAGSALRRGLLFTIHADSPIVPMEPLRLVWSAVNRRTRSGFELGADQKIGVMDALRAVTIDAAYQHFEDDIKGSLEPGKLADLVVLSSSPLDDPERIDEIEVVETIVGGKSVYLTSAGS